MGTDDFFPDTPLDLAWTPPTSWYLSQSMYENERRQVFKNRWLFVGRRDQLQSPGDYFSGTLLDEPYVVVKREDHSIAAYANVCRHHGAKLCEGEGNLSAFVCPYHNWTYNLQGQLKKATQLGKIRNFKGDDFSLYSLPVLCWGPLIFINFAINFAENLDDKSLRSDGQDFLRDLDPLLKKLEQQRFSQLHFHKRKSYLLESNWKIFVDNYLDGGYHVPMVHKELCSHLDMDQYSTQLHSFYSLQTCSGKGGDERVGQDAIYAWIYPNLMINRYGDMMDTNWILPLGVDKTLVTFDYFFDPESLGQKADFTTKMEEFLRSSDQVQLEDGELCRLVQEGIKSSFYHKGRYVPQFEGPMFHFHQLLYQDYQKEITK